MRCFNITIAVNLKTRERFAKQPTKSRNPKGIFPMLPADVTQHSFHFVLFNVHEHLSLRFCFFMRRRAILKENGM